MVSDQPQIEQGRTKAGPRRDQQTGTNAEPNKQEPRQDQQTGTKAGPTKQTKIGLR
jgi:hypothetical protein